MCLFALCVMYSAHERREPGSDIPCFQVSCCAGQWSLCTPPGLDSEGAEGVLLPCHLAMFIVEIRSVTWCPLPILCFLF